MKTGHDGADRDVQDLGRVRVAEVAEVNEHEHVTEVVRHCGERRHDVVLRQTLYDLVLVGDAVPVLLARALWDDVPDEGARALAPLLVPCDDLGPPGDVDYPEDLPDRFREAF